MTLTARKGLPNACAPTHRLSGLRHQPSSLFKAEAIRCGKAVSFHDMTGAARPGPLARVLDYFGAGATRV
ncbi:MAG: hypothetical protein F4X16_07200 [Caldilineaceae bacterium SB0661_bin_34]|nr:hypothetical protein [Caldilineaceae bacterium SB0661_bin_34]